MKLNRLKEYINMNPLWQIHVDVCQNQYNIVK